VSGRKGGLTMASCCTRHRGPLDVESDPRAVRGHAVRTMHLWPCTTMVYSHMVCTTMVYSPMVYSPMVYRSRVYRQWYVRS
jgi:hypothetical protein